MKKYNLPLFFVFIFSVLIASSCKNNNTENVEDNQITFDTLRLNKSYHLKNDSTMPSCNLDLNFVYPTKYADNVGILDSVQDIFISYFLDPSYKSYKADPQQALEKYREDYVNNYLHDIEIFYKEKDLDHDDEGKDKYLSYYETIKNEIVYNKNNILSFQISQTNYKGGASSYLLIKNYVVDLTTGKVVFEKDIFNNGYEDALTPIFKEYLLKTNNVKNISDLQNMGYFDVDEIIPNENMLVDDKGITYIFNKGEFSTYSADPIKVFLPYEEIEPLLKKESPISHLFETK